jgi:hypothetical protein
VEYFKDAEALPAFEVLAYQALAYASTVLGDNWLYYAPLVMICPEEPTTKEVENAIMHLSQRGNAALAYALCLKAQIETEPVRKQPPAFAPYDLEKTEEKQIEPITWPPCRARYSGLLDRTQSEIAGSHMEETADCFRRSWDRPGTYLIPKERLVGFARGRGGQAHRKKST